MTLEARVREADGTPEGALVLLHGRGADELDLFPLLDYFDPERRLVAATPRAPLALPPVAIGHGRLDSVIGVEFGRAARDLLGDAGADVTYHESPVPHTIDPEFARELPSWIERRLP